MLFEAAVRIVPFLPFFLLERGKRLVEEVCRLRLRRDAHGAVLPPQPVVNAQKLVHSFSIREKNKRKQNMILDLQLKSVYRVRGHF